MFEAEEKVFDRHLDQWVAQRRSGWHAVIAGAKVLGIRRSVDAAMRLGIRGAGLGEFMIKQIWPRGTVEWTTHLEFPKPVRARRAG